MKALKYFPFVGGVDFSPAADMKGSVWAGGSSGNAPGQVHGTKSAPMSPVLPQDPASDCLGGLLPSMRRGLHKADHILSEKPISVVIYSHK